MITPGPSGFVVPHPTRTEERFRALGTLDTNGTTTIRLPRRRPGQPAIVSRLIAAIPAAAGDVLQDTFTRVTANGWGTPSPLGPAYVILEGAAATFGTDGALANLLNPAGSANTNGIHSPVGLANVRASVRYALGGGPVAGWRIRLIARAAAGVNYYYVEGVTDGTPNIITVNLGKRVASVDTIIATAATAALAPPQPMVLTCLGSAISGSIGAVALATTDFTITAAGGVGAARVSTAVNQQVNYDDLSAAASAGSPIWDAYINDTGQLINLIDSSVDPVDRWIPQITNGQRLNPGEDLIVVPRSGVAGSGIIVTGSFVYST